MKRIIVPIDFSDIAWNAAKHAIEYAIILNAEVVLINTFSDSQSILPLMSYYV